MIKKIKRIRRATGDVARKFTRIPEGSQPQQGGLGTRNQNIDKYANGIAKVNGAVTGSTSIEVDGVIGISVGSKIFGPGVDITNNTVTAVHASGSPITLADTQTLADTTILTVYGSSPNANIKGVMKINRFPSISTDVFYDIDRAFILATNS